MTLLVILPLLTSALFYLGSRAQITSWLWGRYPLGLARFMDCAACTGFWWGLILSLTLARHERLDLLAFAPFDPVTPLVTGLCSMVWTPIVAGLMQRGFDWLGHAVVDSPQEDDHNANADT